MVAGKEKAPQEEGLESDLKRVGGALGKLGDKFASGFPAMNRVPLGEVDFIGMLLRLREMLQEIEALRDWVDFKALGGSFQDSELGGFFENLTSKGLFVRADDLPNVLRKSLLQAWLNRVFADDVCLGGFRGENHERLISEFRDLDRKHWEQGVHSIIREINRYRPTASVIIPGGELGILLREANKQRRHLPLRKLFGLIPNLLTQLKPCLLMSPISVSQFLDPDKMKFDLVIFDEASQLRSDPSNPGRFILGIECDGATYHSSATARDRDRIRQQILERLGWRIHRIWSPDWVTRHGYEASRLKGAIDAALRDRKDNSRPSTPGNSNRLVVNDGPIVVEKEMPDIDDKFVLPKWVEPYKVCRLRPPRRNWHFHDPDAQPEMKGMLSQIIDTEGPVHKDVAATRLARAWELERIGERMVNAVKSAWRSLSHEKMLRIQGEFLWPSAESVEVTVRHPTAGDDQSHRSIEEIPSEEIALAMKKLTRDSLSIERDKLLVYVARIFGFERSGNHIQRSLGNVLEDLLESRQLVLLEGRVSLPN